jgi:hypothetical protein
VEPFSPDVSDHPMRERRNGSHSPSGETNRWIAQTAPLFPFSMWPIGYFSFLEPLLAGNRYTGHVGVRIVRWFQRCEAKVRVRTTLRSKIFLELRMF